MKFEYDKTVDKERKPVAWLYRMEDSFGPDDLTLCIPTNDPDNFIWVYNDMGFTIQSGGPYGEPLKVFYEGDSLTITF